MNIHRRLLLPSLFTVGLVLLAPASPAPAAPAESPFDFPALTASKPFQRYWWAWTQRAVPGGDIPVEALRRAAARIEALPQEGGGLGTAGFWTSIGPQPIVVNATLSYTGRVATIAVDPTDLDRWLIGAAQGGIWETTDAGVTWSPLTDAQPSLSMGAIVFAPSNPLIVYAGTGEAVFSGDAYGGVGILKSTDGGSTWSLLPDTSFDGCTFSDLEIDPASSDTLIAAASRGLAGTFSGSGCTNRGIYKSTDGGGSWTQKISGPGTDLEIDATNFDNQYAGVGEIFGDPANGVYRSTDGGDTWSPIAGPWDTAPGGIGRVEMAMAPTNPNVLYVSVQDAFDNVGSDGNLLGMWKSTNALAATPTWTAINTAAANNICNPQCWYDHITLVDRVDPDVLYAGGVNLWRLNGLAWSFISSNVHVDHHALAWAGTRLINGNDGGVWSSTDGGASFDHHNDELALTQYYDGAVHPTTESFVLAGSQDNGTHLGVGDPAWSFVFGGDGADNVISSQQPDLWWALSTQRQVIWRTLDGGGSVNSAGSGIDTAGAPFIGTIKNCGGDDDVFIAGTDNLWRSNNFFTGSATWASNGPEMGTGVRGMAFAPTGAACSTYAFGDNDGELRLTTDGGGTWTDLDPLGQAPARVVTDMIFDPADPNKLYVSFAGFDTVAPAGHLFKTTNALAATPTWTSVSPPVDLPANAVALTPDGEVFVASDLGVWASPDEGLTWSHFDTGDGMPAIVVYDLFYSPATQQLVAFTHGRGAFVFSGSTIFTDGFESGDTSAWN